MTISDLEKRLRKRLKGKKKRQPKSATPSPKTSKNNGSKKSQEGVTPRGLLNLGTLDLLYRIAQIYGAEETKDASLMNVERMIGINDSSASRYRSAMDKLYGGNREEWVSAFISIFPSIRDRAIQLLDRRAFGSHRIVITSPPAVATSFLPQALHFAYTALKFAKNHPETLVEFRPAREPGADLLDMTYGTLQLNILEDFLCDQETLTNVGIQSEELFSGLPIGFIFPPDHALAGYFEELTKSGDDVEWRKLATHTLLLNSPYRLTEALVRHHLPAPSKGGTRIYLHTLNSIRACITRERWQAIGIGVRGEDDFDVGHYGFNNLPDTKRNKFLRTNSVARFNLLYRKDSATPGGPLELLLKAIRLTADPPGGKKYVHPYRA